jgi:hypothetical protein
MWCPALAALAALATITRLAGAATRSIALH